MTRFSRISRPGSSRSAARRSLTIALAFTVGIGALHGPAAADDDEYGELVPNEYIVVLKSDGSISQAVAGIPLLSPPEQLVPGSRVWKVTFPTTDPKLAVDQLKNSEGIESAQPNPVTSLAEFSGVFILFWSDWSAQPVPAPASSYVLNQPALASAQFGATGVTAGRGVTVAVLDTGVERTHPALAKRLLPGFDVVNDDPNPSEEQDGIDNNGNGLADEAFGHGTHVAGLVALAAPGASILPIRVLDTDGTSNAWNVLQAIERAHLGGASVINMSFGGGWLGQAVDDRIKSLSESGVVFVAAAGNEASSMTRYPAGSDHVLSVNAVNGSTGRPADFSNLGSWVDVSAPGVGLVSTFPGGRYAAWGGTSAASPLVSGLVARVRQRHPSADASTIADKVTASSNPAELPGFSAYGAIQPREALRR